MKKTIIFIFTFLYLGILYNSLNAQTQPTFIVRVLNCSLSDTLGGDDNVLKFDIYVEHTNFLASGPFELALNQYFLDFDPTISNGGNLSYSIVPGSSHYIPTHTLAIPRAPQIIGTNLDILALATNIALGAGNGPIISSTYPGTRVVTMRLATDAYSFAFLTPSFAWRTALTLPNPRTKIFAYIGTTSTNITQNGIYIPDCDTVLPVELVSLTSTVTRNNVVLNWTTSREFNSLGFDIERKLTSDINWARIGNVAGNGNSEEPKYYTYLDKTNTGKYNYRLKQMDFNGNFEYFNLSNEVEVGIPTKYNISQNYPNPFNPTTKIDYDIPFDGKVNIVLYDIAGREITNPVNEVKTAGYYTIQFNASNFASGVYFYRINAGSYVSTKKMVVLK